MAVVAALELDDAVAAGESAREADRAHRRLGARADHAQPLDRRHEFDDPARELGLDHRRRAEGQAVRGAARDRGDDLRVRVPQDHRSPGSDVVDQAAAVLGFDRGAARAADEERLSAHAAKCAHRRVHAAGNVEARFLEEGHDRRQRRATRKPRSARSAGRPRSPTRCIAPTTTSTSSSPSSILGHLLRPARVAAVDEHVGELGVALEVVLEAPLEAGLVAVAPGVEHRLDQRLDAARLLERLQQDLVLQRAGQAVEKAELAVERFEPAGGQARILRRGLDDLFDAVLDVVAVRLQRHHRDREARKPGLEHRERVERHAGVLGRLAHALRVRPEQFEQVAAFGIDRARERDGRSRRLVLRRRCRSRGTRVQLRRARRRAHRRR